MMRGGLFQFLRVTCYALGIHSTQSPQPLSHAYIRLYTLVIN